MTDLHDGLWMTGLSAAGAARATSTPASPGRSSCWPPGGGGGAAGPLALLASVLRFQTGRVAVPAVVAAAGAAATGAELRMAAGRFPSSTSPPSWVRVAAELPLAVGRPDRSDRPARAVGGRRSGAGRRERPGAGVPGRRPGWTTWRARKRCWRSGCGWPPPPLLETARATVPMPGREEWSGAACPACGGLPQASVIAEESGEFMGGSPRALICGRCAGLWTFPRAICAWCGETDPRQSAVVRPRRAPRRCGSTAVKRAAAT